MNYVFFSFCFEKQHMEMDAGNFWFAHLPQYCPQKSFYFSCVLDHVTMTIMTIIDLFIGIILFFFGIGLCVLLHCTLANERETYNQIVVTLSVHQREIFFCDDFNCFLERGSISSRTVKIHKKINCKPKFQFVYNLPILVLFRFLRFLFTYCGFGFLVKIDLTWLGLTDYTHCVCLCPIDHRLRVRTNERKHYECFHYLVLFESLNFSC